MHDNTPFLRASLLYSPTTYATAATHGSTDEHGSTSTATAEATRVRGLLWSAVENLLTHRGLSATELEASHRALDWWENNAESTDLPIERARTLLHAWNLPEGTTYDILHDEVIRVPSDAWHADAHGPAEAEKHELLADAMSDEDEARTRRFACRRAGWAARSRRETSSPRCAW